MSIIVFWLESTGDAGHQAFEASQLLDALKFSEERRREGRRHVCISSELEQSVGKSGVTAVEQGHLPDGHRYDFDKSHRGAGPGAGSSRGRR
jgi:hypothetical protein